MADHWKNYEPIDRVAMFDGSGAGPSLERVSVTANCSPSQDYPDCRIAIHFGALASAALTLEQIDTLLEQLTAAREDVSLVVPDYEAMPLATPAIGTEGRCESCSVVIRAGELVHAYDDATVHAGPCPGEESGDG